MITRQKPAERVWEDFSEHEELTERQLEQFQQYAELLMTWNKDFNLTAITDLSGIVRQHFEDSLAIKTAINVLDVPSIADIGAGAGFPSLPLKIKYPHLKVYLIEVTKKKQRFLQAVVDALGLTDVEIVDCDWRTLLRTTNHTISLFATRAALPDTELIRMFKPACVYNTTKLIYWASSEWQAHKKVEPYISQDISYTLGKRERRLIVFARPQQGQLPELDEE